MSPSERAWHGDTTCCLCVLREPGCSTLTRSTCRSLPSPGWTPSLPARPRLLSPEARTGSSRGERPGAAAASVYPASTLPPCSAAPPSSRPTSTLYISHFRRDPTGEQAWTARAQGVYGGGPPATGSVGGVGSGLQSHVTPHPGARRPTEQVQKRGEQRPVPVHVSGVPGSGQI